VPPSSKSLARQNQQATDLFKRFTGHDLEWAEDVELPDIPAALAVIGKIDFIGYTTRRDGKTEAYKHDFSRGSKPLLCIAPDGSQIYIVGGLYVFTERGIVDTDKAGRPIQ
jgi:hypothetical protein